MQALTVTQVALAGVVEDHSRVVRVSLTRPRRVSS